VKQIYSLIINTAKYSFFPHTNSFMLFWSTVGQHVTMAVGASSLCTTQVADRTPASGYWSRDCTVAGCMSSVF